MASTAPQRASPEVATSADRPSLRARVRQALGHPFYRRHGKWLRLLPSLAALALYAQHAQRFIERTSFRIEGQRYDSLFDDAMISMRYAWNLVHGHGLVWNPGERVEGYTNPLWTLVMAGAVATFSKNGAVLAMQVLGASLLGIGGFVYGRIASRLVQRSHPVLAALIEGAVVLGVVSIWPLRFWTHMGMEVGALVVTGALSWWLVLEKPTPRRLVHVGALMAVSYALRPDGFIALVPAFVLGLVSIKAGPKQALRAIAPFLLVVAAFLVWRMAYYGSPVPNTYRLKMGGFPLGFRLRNGWAFVRPYLEQTARFWIIGFLVLLKRRDLRTLALLSVPCLLVAYQIYVGGDPWPEWRQLSPAYPIFVLLAWMAAVELAKIVRWLSRRIPLVIVQRRRHLPGFSLVVLGSALLLTRFAMAPTRKVFAAEGALHYNRSWNKANVLRGLVLRRILTRDAGMAVFWGGATPYVDTDHRAIDILGKCDDHVAGMAPDLVGAQGWAGMTSVPGHNKTDLEYSIQSLEADYTETFDWNSDHVSARTRRQFVKHTIAGQTFWLRKKSPNVDWEAVAREEEKDQQKEDEKQKKPR